jgi:tetrahedral aminopeptidase
LTTEVPGAFHGPNINPHVFDRLAQAARSADLAIQVRGAPRATGTDANAIQLIREGVATGLIGIPNRYMHSPVEVVSLDDLDRAARLLAEFCAGVTTDANWVP